MLKCIPVPTLITESGRALISHHAVLIFDVIFRCVRLLPCGTHTLSWQSNGCWMFTIVVHPCMTLAMVLRLRSCPSALMNAPVCRQGHACQPRTAKPEEAAEAEHHIVKAARKEELSPRLTPQGQVLLQASRAVTRAVQATAASMREAHLRSLSLKCAP